MKYIFTPRLNLFDTFALPWVIYIFWSLLKSTNVLVAAGASVMYILAITLISFVIEQHYKSDVK